MARRRSANRGLDVSLFPFLSVLACVIGTLTLLIAAIALGQMGSDQFFDRWQALQREIAADATAAERIRARIAQAHALLAEWTTARETLEDLGLRPDDALDDQLRVLDRVADADRLQAEQRELETQLASLRSSIDTQREVIAEQAVARGAQQPIVLKPAGTGRDLRPWFVECRFDELIVYDAANEPDMTVSRAFVEHSWDFRRFLGTVRDDRTARVIFLIRPDGVDTYERARRAADGVRVRHGKIPLPGYGKLDFSEVSPDTGSGRLGRGARRSGSGG